MASTTPAPAPDAANNPLTFGFNLPECMAIAGFCGICWFNTVELQARIWTSFKRYTGLYFWALVVSSWGCAGHALSFIFLDFYIIKNAQLAGILIGISWWCMVTGQALVLYSRLHLVVRDKRKIRWVLAMIITNVFILHIPISIISQMAYAPVPHQAEWALVYKYYEKIQMTGFTIQETIISGLYLYECRKVLRPGQVFQKKKVNQVIQHLIWVNVLILFLDAALLATEYANLFSIETVFKAAAYSTKLRFELIVLNQLMDIVGMRTGVFSLGDSNTAGGTHSSQMAGESHQLSAVRRHTQQAGANYSAFASQGRASVSADQKGDGVMRTTEITVDEVAEISPDVKKTEDFHAVSGEVRQGRNISRNSRGYFRQPSESSEVNFAGKGVQPSGAPGVEPS